MNIKKSFPRVLNEKSRVKNKPSFTLLGYPIHQGVVLESSVNFADKTIKKVIAKKVLYFFENNKFKSVTKLPKKHPIKKELKLIAKIKFF
ncbi:hypothetical protein ABHN84_08310 [Shewanella vesiculosa]|uniref:Uncharacterized protein n=1 Tax=Shewanella vesiculosa TaxID=518738 RepID=A0ABV0FQM9_9GAMM